MKDEFNRGGQVPHLLLRYMQALITQMSQTAVCNRHHTLDQQLCRWLLMSLDRVEGGELVMTHELIANMRSAAASAMPWLKKNTTACCLQNGHSKRHLNHHFNRHPKR